jgi:hypothetical protein
MADPKPTKPVNSQKQSTSTQDTLLISEIRDGVVVMRDGSLRAVIIASAINFDLMSGSEREAVEYSYQGFLNSLHYPVQILIKSQKIDLDAYIAKLQQLRQDQDNELLGLLMDDYITNIQALIEEVNIMDKQFYVIIPYFPPATTKLKQGNIFSSISGLFKKQEITTITETDFEQFKTELGQRVQQVSAGLSQMGVRNIPLNTQELIDLYYASYNPDVAENQKLVDVGQIQTAAVTKGEGEAPTRLNGGGNV